MKLVTKLAITLILSGCGFVMIGALSLQRLKEVNTDFQYVMDNTLPSFNTINETNAMFLELRIKIRNFAFGWQSRNNDLYGGSDLETEAKNIRANGDLLLAKLSGYEKLFSDERDAVIYNDAKSELVKYLKMLDDLLIMIVSTRGSIDDISVANIAINDLAKQSKLVSRTFSEIVHYNEVLARDLAQKDHEYYGNAQITIVMSSILMLSLLLVLGLIVFKQLTFGVSEMKRVMDGVSRNLDFTIRGRILRSDEMGMLLSTFNVFLDTLHDAILKVKLESASLASTINALEASASTVANGSASQNQATSLIAASIEQLSVSIHHVGEQADLANQRAISTGQIALNSQQVIEKTTSQINSIFSAVNSVSSGVDALKEKNLEISKVIGVIRDVAERTNLLALNAAIEAARAGEHGRGFAVVADEVRNLAARTASSTTEISQLIGTIADLSYSARSSMDDAVKQVQSGVKLAKEADVAMSQIAQVAESTISLVDEMTTSLKEQSIATNSIAEQIEIVAKMVDENNSAASTTSEISEKMTEATKGINSVVALFKLTE